MSQIEEVKDSICEVSPAKAELQEEKRVTILVKDALAETPKRLDLSSLKPENAENENELIPSVMKIRSGSLSEKRDMDILISNGKSQEKLITVSQVIDSPAVLVIRSKKHSLDEKDIT